MYEFNIQVIHGAAEAAEKFVTVRVKPGWCKFIKVKTNDNDNNVTTTLKVYDVDGDAIYSKAAIAENAVTLDDTKTIPMTGDVKIGVTPSGVPGASTSIVDVRFWLVE